MPFCYSPWSNLDIDPMGAIGPCCKFQHRHYDRAPLNILTNDLSEYQQSPTLEQIKTDFRNGQWPLGCERCKIEEENGVLSKRQLDWDRWQSYYQNYDIEKDGVLTASVAFGNTCNLKCITCGPYSSSHWQKEYKEIFNINIAPNHFYKRDFVETFFHQNPKLIHLDIPGGEPFLSGVKQQKELLQKYIDSGQAREMSLHYTTNATVWPDDDWWSLWTKFKSVDMQLSLDAVGEKFEYIRYPADWTLVQEHVRKYRQKAQEIDSFDISISHTVSAFNIYYLDEFFDWCMSFQLPRPWLGRVNNPTYMRPTIWPEPLRRSVVSHLLKSDKEDVQTWAKLIANNDDSEHFQRFLALLGQHDSYRGNRFRKTFPELQDLLDQHGDLDDSP